MADIKQDTILIDRIPRAIQQRIAAGAKFTGVAPSLSGEPFVPYYDDATGIVRMKQHDNPTADQADLGGLFTFGHTKPILIEQVWADFGAAMNWSVAINNELGDFTVYAGTGTRYITQFQSSLDSFILLPGEQLKVVSSVNGAGWVRVFTRLFIP